MPAEAPDARQAVLFDQRLAEQDAAHPGYRQAWLAFEETLLRHGGRRAVPPLEPDVLIGLLAEEGAVFEGDTATVAAGEPSDCHVNAARMWRAHGCDAIGTGYALSDDGLWRQHSWGSAQGFAVETTTSRLRYFGVVMSGDRAKWFADWVDPSP